MLSSHVRICDILCHVCDYFSSFSCLMIHSFIDEQVKESTERFAICICATLVYTSQGKQILQ